MDGLQWEHFIKMDDDWGYPYDSGNHQMFLTFEGDALATGRRNADEICTLHRHVGGLIQAAGIPKSSASYAQLV